MSTTARTATGDLQLPRVLVTAPAQVALQTILDTFGLWQSSFYLATNQGFPWLQQVLGVKNPNVTLLKGLFEQAILYCPYVASVTAQVFFDAATRAFSYTFRAILNTGEVLTGGSNQAFVVQPSGGGSASQAG